jgi:hypothetical protein
VENEQPGQKGSFGILEKFVDVATADKKTLLSPCAQLVEKSLNRLCKSV